LIDAIVGMIVIADHDCHPRVIVILSDTKGSLSEDVASGFLQHLKRRGTL
jgi:hypothetical protein